MFAKRTAGTTLTGDRRLALWPMADMQGFTGVRECYTCPWLQTRSDWARKLL
jgi:hypothetical protein